MRASLNNHVCVVFSLLMLQLLACNRSTAQTTDCLDCSTATSEKQRLRCIVLNVVSSLNIPNISNSEGDPARRVLQSPCDYILSETADPDPCSVAPGRIVCLDDGKGGQYLHGIYVSQFKLGGRLPEQLAYAPKLRDLRLDGGKIEGTLPASWSALTSLQDLDLSSNYLSGKLPKEWASLRSLQNLDLSDNKLTGQVPEEWAKLDLRYVNLADNKKMRSKKCPYWYNVITLNLGYTQMACEPSPRKKYCLDNKKRAEREGRAGVLRDFRGDMCSNEQRDLRLGLAWGLFGLISCGICIDAIIRWFLVRAKQQRARAASHDSAKSEATTVTVKVASSHALPAWFQAICDNRMVKVVWSFKNALVAGWDVISDSLLAIQVYPNWPFYLIVLTMFMPDIITCVSIILNMTRHSPTPARVAAVVLGLPFLAPLLPVLLLLAAIQHYSKPARHIPNIFPAVSTIRTVELLHWMVGFIEAPALAVLTSCIYYIGNKPEIGWFIDWRIFFLSLASAFLDLLMHLWRIRALVLESAAGSHSLSSSLRALFTDLHLPAHSYTPHKDENNTAAQSEAGAPESIKLELEVERGQPQPDSPAGSQGAHGPEPAQSVTAVQQVANALTQVAVTAANAV